MSSLSVVKPPTTDMPSAKAIDSPVVLNDTDVESNGTEVSKPSSDGEMVESPPAESMPTGGVLPPEFKLVIPEPLEQASKLALVAVQEWWKNLEPFLKQMQAQILLQLDPLLKASEEQFKKLEAQLAPHTAPAMKLVEEWKAKLEPHAKVAMEKAQEASVLLKEKAYEPAMAAIAQASTAVQAQAAATTKLVSEKWVEAQPVIKQLHELAMAHAKMALEALIEWKKQIEPLAIEQFKLAQANAITYSNIAKQKGLELSLQAGEGLKVLGAQTQVQMAALGQKMGEEIEKGKVAAAPHVEKMKVFADEKIKEVAVKMEPVTKPIVQWSEETGKKLEPITKPLGEAAKKWAVQIHAQLLVLREQLEGPAEAFQAWFMNTMQCLCLPIQQSLNFKGADAPAADYPAPVTATIAKPVD